MADYNRVVEMAMALRAQAPEDWQNFVAAMRDFSVATTADILRAPPELLLKAQGIAVAMTELVSIYQSAPELWEKIRDRKKHG
jgi:poly-gamma-glutamate capsule biosynthesis protein CapA/YwtB (metallophosphatase superfamily)